jgi:hypothetical protein
MERVGKSLVGKRARRSRRGWTYSGWELAAVDVGNTVVSINDDQLDADNALDCQERARLTPNEYPSEV